ncbi:hypothetical protein ACF0H5_024305 [Mactra antiquata]
MGSLCCRRQEESSSNDGRKQKSVSVFTTSHDQRRFGMDDAIQTTRSNAISIINVEDDTVNKESIDNNVNCSYCPDSKQDIPGDNYRAFAELKDITGHNNSDFIGHSHSRSRERNIISSSGQSFNVNDIIRKTKDTDHFNGLSRDSRRKRCNSSSSIDSIGSFTSDISRSNIQSDSSSIDSGRSCKSFVGISKICTTNYLEKSIKKQIDI